MQWLWDQYHLALATPLYSLMIITLLSEMKEPQPSSNCAPHAALYGLLLVLVLVILSVYITRGDRLDNDGCVER